MSGSLAGPGPVVSPGSLAARAAVQFPEITPYLRACEQGKLSVPGCAQCGRLQWPPRPRCRYCGHDEFGWTEVPGRGALYSWTVTHRAPGPEFARLTPYTIAIVSLDVPEVLRMVGRMTPTRETPPDLRIGDPMVASFETQPGGDVLVLWSPE